MDFITYLIIVAAFYGVLLFFDTFFKTCAHYPYVQFLKNTGFEIGIFRIKWSTTFCNRFILRLGSSRTKMLYYWFEAGLYISLLLLPIAISLLVIADFQLFFPSATTGSSEQSQPILEPLIPGFNLPTSEFGYYAASLFICSIVHEFGHAVAAVKEDVHLIDIGANIFLFIPAAFVNISSEKLSLLSQWRILRIMCAGIWHNIVLMTIAGLMYLTLPALLSPIYTTNAGVIVTDILPKSHLAGIRGLERNDIVTAINDCKIIDSVSWHDCLSLAPRVQKPGYCVDTDLVHELDESGPFVQLANGAWDCCAPDSTKHMCFEYLEREQAGGVAEAELPQHTCLPARRIVEAATSQCLGEGQPCSTPYHCIRPLLANDTSLLVLKRVNNNKPNVVYIGHPADVFLTVSVSAFIPKYPIFGIVFANVINNILRYITVFSGGLAVVNVLPCLFFDGQHIINALAILILRNRFSKQTVSTVAAVTTIFGTLLLFSNFLYSFRTFVFRV